MKPSYILQGKTEIKCSAVAHNKGNSIVNPPSWRLVSQWEVCAV